LIVSVGLTRLFEVKLNIEDCEIWRNELEISLYRMFVAYVDILRRLGVDHECDRRTDGRTDILIQKYSKCSRSLRSAGINQ